MKELEFLHKDFFHQKNINKWSNHIKKKMDIS